MPQTMVVAGYNPENDEWSLLDPVGDPSESKEFKNITTEELENFWQGWYLWGSGTMISLIP